MSAGEGERQGEPGEAWFGSGDTPMLWGVLRVASGEVEICSAECGSEPGNCRMVAMRSSDASVLRRFPTFTHYS